MVLMILPAVGLIGAFLFSVLYYIVYIIAGKDLTSTV